MFTMYQLIDLALGKDEARHVDTAIPQGTFDSMTVAQRENIAGWYYGPNPDTGRRSIFGRLLTQDECWKQIEHKIKNYKLKATMGDNDISFIMLSWSCWKDHVKRGEIMLSEEKEEGV